MTDAQILVRVVMETGQFELSFERVRNQLFRLFAMLNPSWGGEPDPED